MRGRNFFGPGFWKGGPGPAGGGRGLGMGRGMGNRSPFCRFLPWLPRRWWAVPGRGAGAPGPWAAQQAQGVSWGEADALQEQAGYLRRLLDEINRRLGEPGGRK